MYVTRGGMVCAVGLNAASACAAMRAGISNFVELHLRDNSGEAVIGATVPTLPQDLGPDERLVELLVLALADCLPIGPADSFDRIPLLVGLPEKDRKGEGAAAPDWVIERVEEKLGVRFHQTLSRMIPSGHTAGFEALQLARDLIREQKTRACLVCGVDSYIDARAVQWLDQYSRLKTDDNPDGVIPGEAAAAVLIERECSADIIFNVLIAGLGMGRESAGVLNEEPLLGHGLAQAAKEALAEAGIQMHDLDFRISDVTGESYGFKEQALALSRLMRARREKLPLWAIADTIGDCGAAAGVCQLVVVRESFIKDYALGDYAACYASGVRDNRAVVILRRTEGRNCGL